MPKPKSASPERRIPSLDPGQAPAAAAKASVVVMHYNLGTLD
ncbi:MAG TPA: hypothetical protein VKM93_03970 [Terriglobia bacterium]|nr:hypothetical protein [Terriglobia bacterium]